MENIFHKQSFKLPGCLSLLSARGLLQYIIEFSGECTKVVLIVVDFRQRRKDSLPQLKSEFFPRTSAVITITEDYPAVDIILLNARVHEFPLNCQNSFLEAGCHREIHNFM